MIVLCVFIITTYIKVILSDPNTEVTYDVSSQIATFSSEPNPIRGVKNENNLHDENIHGSYLQHELQDDVDLAEGNCNKNDKHRQSSILIVPSEIIREADSIVFIPVTSEYKEYACRMVTNNQSESNTDVFDNIISCQSFKPLKTLLYDNEMHNVSDKHLNDKVSGCKNETKIGEDFKIGKIVEKRDCQLLSLLKYSQMNPSEILANRASLKKNDVQKYQGQANVRSKNEISSLKIPLLPSDTLDTRFATILDDANFLENEIQMSMPFYEAQTSTPCLNLRKRQEMNDQICQENPEIILETLSPNNLCRSNIQVESTENCIINIPIEINIYDSSCEIIDENQFHMTSDTGENCLESNMEFNHAVESSQYEYQENENPSDEIWTLIPEDDFINYTQTCFQNNNTLQDIASYLTENILSALLSYGTRYIGTENKTCNTQKPLDDIIVINSDNNFHLDNSQCISQYIMSPTCNTSIPDIIYNENDDLSQLTYNVSIENGVLSEESLNAKPNTKPCISTITINVLPNDDMFNNHVIVIV